MNKLKLSLENFQCISYGELEFQTGLNFIIGQSNSGKSATFRALKMCLSNPKGSQHLIKNGTKYAQVTLDFNNNSITWKRTPKECTYEINGETYIKTGGSNAFKILEDTGFVKDINDTIMNIEEELQVPFPFGVSKTDLFRLYEDVFCISDSSIILKSAKKEEEKVEDIIKEKENEIIRNKRKAEELQKFKEDVNIELLDSYKNTLIKKTERLDFLKDGLDFIKSAHYLQKANLEICSITFDNKFPLYKEKVSLINNVQLLKNVHQLSKELLKVKLEITPKLNQYNMLVHLKSTLNKINQLECINFINMEFKNKTTYYTELKKYKTDLKSILQKISEKKKELADINANLEYYNEELRKFKVCPLCHGILERKEN